MTPVRIKPTWRWIFLAAPALVLLVTSACGWWLMDHYPNRPDDTITFQGMAIAAALSPILGFWAAWSLPSWPRRILGGILFSGAILVVNFWFGWTVWDVIQNTGQNELNWIPRSQRHFKETANKH